MDTIEFLVQGTAAEPYRLTFRKTGNNLNAFCTCPASAGGRYCKHRFAILGGETAGIVSGNADQVKVVLGWLPGSDVAEAMQALLAAEQELERAGNAVSKAQQRLAASLIA